MFIIFEDSNKYFTLMSKSELMSTLFCAHAHGSFLCKISYTGFSFIDEISLDIDLITKEHTIGLVHI